MNYQVEHLQKDMVIAGVEGFPDGYVTPTVNAIGGIVQQVVPGGTGGDVVVSFEDADGSLHSFTVKEGAFVAVGMASGVAPNVGALYGWMKRQPRGLAWTGGRR